MVDQKQYGRLIELDEEAKFQVNLAPGQHKCYVEIVPKHQDHESFKSNVLKIDVPTTDDSLHERTSQRQLSDKPLHDILQKDDIPVPQLSVQTVNSSSIRTNWYLDRAMPSNAFVALFEVHIRGDSFPDYITSDEKIEQDGYIEHIWHVVSAPLQIEGISEQQEYTIFLRALFHVYGSTDISYLSTDSNKVITTNIDRSGDMLPRPILTVADIGLQMVTLSWKLSSQVDESLVKGYRIIQNSKPTEIISPNQAKYDLRNLKPGTTNEIQVSVTSHPDFFDEKISEPIRIACPQRPQPPVIQNIRAEKPFSIRIKWILNGDEQDEITSFKIFLDGNFHEELKTNGRQSFIYDFVKLKAEQNYAIYIKAFIEGKRLDGYIHQCHVESKPSNELLLQCAAPPRGTTPRLEHMDSQGIRITWDAPAEPGDVKVVGYLILKDGRVSEKKLPVEAREHSIRNLEIGNRYSIQILPITDQPCGTEPRIGEEYDPDRHGHYLPGPELEVEYTDLVLLPEELWTEHITGHSASICWSPIDEEATPQQQPDNYVLLVWNDTDLPRDKPKAIQLPKDKVTAILKDLKSDTKYNAQLEASKKRRHQKTNDFYVVTSKSEVITFETGKPPDPPSYFRLVAVTNTHARLEFSPFTEHNAEVIALRVCYKPVSSEENAKEDLVDLTPDQTGFILSNLTERTEYEAKIYAITAEYLSENNYRDIPQLPLKLEPSRWLVSASVKFHTSGCEAIKKIDISQASTDLIQFKWELPEVYGSTKFTKQKLRWKPEHDSEDHEVELDVRAQEYTIKERLPSGRYKISIDAYFSARLSLEDDDEASRKEFFLTTTEIATVRFRIPITGERPKIYLTGYTTNTIDVAWSKPYMFGVIDHPEKLSEQLKIQRKLNGYSIYVDKELKRDLDSNDCKCTLTNYEPNRKYNIELRVKSTVHKDFMPNMTQNDTNNAEKPDEISSEPLSIQTLRNQDYLRSFQANFEFNSSASNGDTIQQNIQIQSIGRIKVQWTISDSKNISHFILGWRSSKNVFYQQKTLGSDQRSANIEPCDEKADYTICITIVTNDEQRHEYAGLTVPTPGEPDAPELWLAKTSDTNFTVKWSEPKSYGIPVTGFQLYIEGKKKDDIIHCETHRAEIPSRINRTYQVSICAITNNPLRPRSLMSSTLIVITTPTTNLIPTISYDNNDGMSTSFDHTVARIIPLQIEPINEEKLHLDWTSFLPSAEIRAYYVHYTCLNNGEVKTMKVSKKSRHCVLRSLRPGFTYGMMVMAVDRNGGVLYTSDKSTIQMNAPPNAPIVAIRERTTTHVKIEWRPAASYGNVLVAGYKIYVNERLAAILSQDQLTYTLKNGQPCDIYTVHVQALSSDKTMSSPMSRAVKFAWPGIKPGAFRRIDNGQTGAITVAWEHPQLEDTAEALNEYKLYSENVVTHAQRMHGVYDAKTHEATIYDLPTGKYMLWLEIQSENHTVCCRPITIVSGRLNLLRNRPPSSDAARCFMKRTRRLRSSGVNTTKLPLLHTQYS